MTETVTLKINREMLDEVQYLAEELIEKDASDCFYSLTDLQQVYDASRFLNRKEIFSVEFPVQGNKYLIEAFKMLSSGEYFRISSLATGRGVDMQNTIHVKKIEFNGEKWINDMFAYCGNVERLKKQIKDGTVKIHTRVYDSGLVFEFSGSLVPEKEISIVKPPLTYPEPG
jgi:hypothetical protein